MTDHLDGAIRSALGDIVAQAPQPGPLPDQIAVKVERHARPRVWAVPLAAAVVAVLGAAVVAAVAFRRDASDGPIAPPDTSVVATTAPSLPPAETLPVTPDLATAPFTVAPGSPERAWYRLQPDLDITWQALETGAVEFCWRTPVDSQCQPADSLGPSLIVPSGGDQRLVLVTVADGESLLDIQLADGTTASAPIQWDPNIGWGVARLALPADAVIEAAGTSSTGAPEPDGVTGQTLPAAFDLVDAPLTVPPGSALNYWRFLPDLDISERATTSGGTEFCWRTPAGTGCIEDSFESPDVGVIPTDGAAIFLVRPGLVPIDPPPTDPLAPTMQLGPNPTAVTVTFSDGTTTTLDVRYPEQYGAGHARVDLPPGITITAAASS